MIEGSIKKQVISNFEGSEWIGTVIGIFVPSMTSMVGDGKLPVDGEVSPGESDGVVYGGSADGSTTSAIDVQNEVRGSRCKATIMNFCPGTGEHFVVFDDDSITPQWICVKSYTLFDGSLLSTTATDFGDDAIEVFIDRGVKDKAKACASPDSDAERSEQECCFLCKKGSFVGSSSEAQEQQEHSDYESLQSCCVCSVLCHSGCMPMDKVGLADDQPWRCWRCTGNATSSYPLILVPLLILLL